MDPVAMTEEMVLAKWRTDVRPHLQGKASVRFCHEWRKDQYNGMSFGIQRKHTGDKAKTKQHSIRTLANTKNIG